MLSLPACSSRTRSSGTSSSSAASIASAVCTPWPISLRGIASTTMPSAAILIQPLSATPPSWARISRPVPSRERWGSTPQPTSNAVPPAAVPSSQVLRFTPSSPLRA
jgi:hypothetical protein